MKITYDEGYQYGLGLFETILLLKGKPISLYDHLQRLEEGLEFLNLESTITAEKVQDYLKNKSFSEKSVLKISVSGKNQIFELKDYPYKAEDFQKGFRLKKSSILRNESSSLVFHKTTNYGDNILEKRRAVEDGYDEPLFFNTKGFLAEGATTNIFLIKDDQLYTPSVESGLLPGIMRKKVINHLPVIETQVTEKDLLQADELFVTNSLLGIMPVSQYEDQEYEMNISYQLTILFEQTNSIKV